MNDILGQPLEPGDWVTDARGKTFKIKETPPTLLKGLVAYVEGGSVRLGSVVKCDISWPREKLVWVYRQAVETSRNERREKLLQRKHIFQERLKRERLWEG